MGAIPVPDKCISISKSGIILGKKVAAFFKNRGVKIVNVILDVNNNTMVIVDTGLDDAHFKGPHQGLRINYESTHTFNTSIRLKQLIRFLQIDYSNIFIAKPFKSNSIIMEDVPIKKSFALRYCIVSVDLKSGLIMFGDFDILKKMKLEDMARTKTVVENSTTTLNTQSSSQTNSK